MHPKLPTVSNDNTMSGLGERTQPAHIVRNALCQRSRSMHTFKVRNIHFLESRKVYHSSCLESSL